MKKINLKGRFFMLIVLFKFWKGKWEYKFRSNTFRTDAINIFAVGVYNFFYNGETKTGSFFVFTAGKVCFVKAFPDFIQAVLWNADAGVFYGNKYFFIFFCRLDGNERVMMTKLYCIINEVVQNIDIERRLTSVEESAKQAHKRIDELKHEWKDPLRDNRGGLLFVSEILRKRPL